MTTNRIKLLPENLVNKIAAGEVIERPFSVVKELVENSIDAGSRNIRVEIEDGGLKSIRIIDDGIGMNQRDAELCLQRHATSKLSTVDDLFTVSTMGFRGEALPSIASVSMMTLWTCSRETNEASRVAVEGGKIKSISPDGAPPGTTIEVRELFFNLPARRKFLKSVASEMRQIVGVVSTMALANPGIGFSLHSDGRELFDYPAAESLAGRVADVFGSNLADRLLAVDYEEGEIAITGFLTKPQDAKRHRSEMRFYVNKRGISSKLIHAAAMAGFGELLPKGCYPVGVLFIAVPHRSVDVNVSPTKSEVRFANEQSIYHSVRTAVNKSVLGSGSIPDVQFEPAQSIELKSRAQDAIQAFFERNRPSMIQVDQGNLALRNDPRVERTAAPGSRVVAERTAIDESESASRVESPARVPDKEVAPYRLIGFGDLYIIALSRESVFIIDQHAAHERVLYEQALKSFDRQSMVSQKLLFPVNVELDAKSLAIAEATSDSLRELGFEAEPFGARSIALYAVPAALRGRNPERVFRSILDDLEGFDLQSEDVNKRLAQSFACRSAIMAGDRLAEEEMAALVRDLFACSNPYVCPHGRPTLLKLSHAELEKHFGR